ncbi:hypothetical protein L6452_37292 [Arctium lappa]|uniref:Uncharacterized protein n=1 Tax=Arctium lappa TaxID=4217 RepID=A0ACB8Y434_ARCLA|nr:hypothetical protein L6452_37292 [Arctium lappa]
MKAREKERKDIKTMSFADVVRNGKMNEEVKHNRTVEQEGRKDESSEKEGGDEELGRNPLEAQSERQNPVIGKQPGVLGSNEECEELVRMGDTIIEAGSKEEMYGPEGMVVALDDKKIKKRKLGRKEPEIKKLGWKEITRLGWRNLGRVLILEW